MFKKIKNFFIKIKPSKRKVIQLYAALLYNANIKGFVTGKIFTGVSKALCLPGLNCYSCPGAVGACPLGSIQNALAASKTKLPTYILGIILLYSIILGRTICGFLCPVGLIQELLYKIKTPKLQKSKVTRVLSYFKYVLLFALVIIIPLMYALQDKNMPLPAFCKFICPAGTFEGAIFLLSNPNNTDFFGMLGSLFTWKFVLLIIILVASVFIFRFFCRFLCPLGAIYGLFNKLSIIGVKVDKSKCNSCGACISHCKMDVKEVGDHECIQCGECRSVCKLNAISWKTLDKIIKEDNIDETVSLNNDEVADEVITESKKDRRISKKLFTRIAGVVATVLLITAIGVVNFQKEPFEINEVCEKLKVSLVDGTEYNISTDNNSTLIYFYEFLSQEELDVIKTYSNDNLNILLISKNSSLEQTDELTNLNIKFANVKRINRLLSSFTNDKEYPYSVFMDQNDKILIKNKGLITTNDYFAIVAPSVSGKTVGNKVGDICINKDINLVGSDEKFSVIDNKGKIVIINFWYTSCTPCVQELPHFDALYKKYSDSIEVIAIHEASIYNTNPQAVKDFIDSQFEGFTIKFGYDDLESQYYAMLGGKQAWPMTIIVDQDGFVSFVRQGSLTSEALEAEITKLLD